MLPTSTFSSDISAHEFANQIPFPLAIFRHDGVLIDLNPLAASFWNLKREDVIGKYNAITDPQGLEQGSAAIFKRVIAGETVSTDPVQYNTATLPGQHNTGVIWMRIHHFPLLNQAGEIAYFASLYENVSEQVELDQKMTTANYELEQQRETLHTMTSPIIQVWEGILTVPLTGALDAGRSMRVIEELLEEIIKQQADIVLLDITGVPVIDTNVANLLLQAVRAVSLLGSQAVLVGIHAELAQTITHLGVDLSQVVTLSNLRAGLEWAFSQQGLVVSKEAI
jgi:anti-anti-sigma factor